MDTTYPPQIVPFVIGIAIYSLLAVLQKKKRQHFVENLWKFLETPLILGSQAKFKRIAMLYSSLYVPLNQIMGFLKARITGFVSGVWTRIWSIGQMLPAIPANPSSGSVPSLESLIVPFIYLLSFLLLSWAEVARLIIFLQGGPYEVPLSSFGSELFSHYELTIFFGTIGTMIIAFSLPRRPKYQPNQQADFRDRILSFALVYAVFGGIVSSAVLALSLFINVANVQQNVRDITQFVVDFTNTFVIPMNIFATLALLLKGAWYGLVRIMFLSLIVVLIVPIATLLLISGALLTIALLLEFVGVELTLKIVVIVVAIALYVLVAPLQGGIDAFFAFLNDRSGNKKRRP